MEEFVLHAPPDLGFLLPLDFFTGLATLFYSSLVSVSSYWSEESDSCRPRMHSLLATFCHTSSALWSPCDDAGLLHGLAAEGGVEEAGLVLSTLDILPSMAEKLVSS